MGNKLSYTACQKFKYCPESWRLYYIEKYRTKQVGSALLFGSALDKAFEYLLLNKDIIKAKELFDSNWNEQSINGNLTEIKACEDVVYNKSDLDEELADNPWDSLKIKGHLILESFNKNLLPLIEHVYSTQEQVELTSGEDKSVGFADTVVKLKGYDKPIILDFKTASRKYKEESAKESEQLAQYLHSLGSKYDTRLVGYAVFLKNINKNRTKVCSKCQFDGSSRLFKTCNNIINEERCNGEWIETIYPTADFQLIVDEIPEEFELKIIDEIGTINDDINNGFIYNDFSKCENNGFYRRCDYYDYCHNNDTSNLVKLNVDKSKKI